jgi:hypothetical protein
VRLARPGRLELRPEGEQEQDRQPLRALDGEAQKLLCGRVDPVHVLVDHEHRLPGGEAVELIKEHLQRALLPALRG